MAMFMPFVSLGLCFSVSRAKNEYKDGYVDFVASIVFLFLLIYFAFVFILMLVYVIYGGALIKKLGLTESLFYVLLAHILFSVVSNIGIEYMRFINRYIFLSFVVVFQAISSFAFSLLLIFADYSGLSDLMGRVLGLLIPDMLLAALFIFYFFKVTKVYVSKVYWCFAIKYSTPMILGSVAYVLSNQFNKVIVNQYCGNKAVAIFSFASSVGLIVISLSNSIIQAITPWIFDRLELGEHGKTNDLFIKLATFFCLVSICIIMSTPEIINILGTNQYYDAVHIIPWIIVSSYVQLLISFEASAQMYFKRTVLNSIIAVICAIVSIACNYSFVPYYGGVGAALASVVCFILMLCLTAYFNKKLFGLTMVNLRMYFISLITIIVCATLATLNSLSFLFRWGMCFLSIALLIFIFRNEIYRFYTRKFRVHEV